MEPDPVAPPAGGTAASVSPPPQPSSSLIFLGTGCSGALPDTRCLIRASTPPCAVCSLGLSLPPERNPNYRLNTSLLIDYCHDDGTHKYILIDIGKTFREQVLRWFVHHKVPSVDSIILTHEHADAVLGLDEVWVVQPRNYRNEIKQIPIFLTRFAMDSITRRFPYLVEQKPEDGDEDAQAAKIDWKIIEEDVEKPFVASGLEFVPLPTGAGQLDLLILEANALHGVGDAFSTHLTLSETLDAIKRIRPKRALLIGMRHFFEHQRENQMLAEWSISEGIPVQLAHDGLRAFIDL
ncbi:putative hydrolase C777.06c isoform X2 [Setaria italica]|uniref:putative hydrolase C777.06c isoform X2 n=1 Tax=Setaria italica TaxID=4555 RepID=UPI000BE5431D|nr:putative hydrolase C777.06c isoform X2 [Setaria italica]